MHFCAMRHIDQAKLAIRQARLWELSKSAQGRIGAVERPLGRIEGESRQPNAEQFRVIVVRETRASDYAR